METTTTRRAYAPDPIRYINNPGSCPYCWSRDTRAATPPAIGHACNACQGIWSDVYRGGALVGYDPHPQRGPTPRQTPHPTAPWSPAYVAPATRARALPDMAEAMDELATALDAPTP